MAGFYIETKLRPCYISDNQKKRDKIIVNPRRKGLFHCWVHKSDIYAPSVLQGGHNGGVVSYEVGLVELEDGCMIQVAPERIRFIPGIFDEYGWGEEEVK